MHVHLAEPASDEESCASRLLHDLTLPFLWRKLKNLRILLRLLPPETWEETLNTEGQIVFVRANFLHLVASLLLTIMQFCSG